MKNKKIIIGSRGSKLALLYAEKAKKSILKNNPELNKDLLDIKIIKTTGDIYQTQRLSDIGGKGLFSKKIEEQLLNKNIDIAVHALKDLPSIETKNLIVDVYLKRADPREILISKNNKNFYELENKSIIGTSSFRREAQIKQLRKDLIIKLIRGNVDTRIRKLKNQEFDAIVLSLAGIQMLNLDNQVKEVFTTDQMLPAIGQGTIALQCKEDDQKTLNILQSVNDKETYYCIQAERALLEAIGGDCNTAIGGLAKLSNQKISLKSELFSNDGNKKFEFQISGHFKEAKEIGYKVGKELLKKAGPDFTTQGN